MPHATEFGLRAGATRRRLPGDPVAGRVLRLTPLLSANRALRLSQAQSKAVIIGITTKLILRCNAVDFTTALPARTVAVDVEYVTLGVPSHGTCHSRRLH